MDNGALADASSLASVKLTVVAVKNPYPNTVTIILSGNISIVSRLCYFDEPLTLESLPLILTESQAEALHQAGRRFLAEKQALVYLNCAEYSEYQLSLKLKRKGYTKIEYQPALNYLAEKRILDDSRFAAAYLRIRSLSRTEGYARLLSELRKRGISTDIAKQALCAFFSEIDETEICTNALYGLMRKGYTEQKLIQSLIRKGFSFSLIKQCMKNFLSGDV